MNDRQLIIVGLVVAGIVLLWYAANKPAQTTEYDARNFVLKDAQGKYPEADISVLMTNFSGNSWKIKVRATLNATSPCPERIHLYYDYPAQQFEARLPEYITKDCRICINVPECVILFPEEALIASHTFPGTQEVKDFLNANPKATGNAKKEEVGKFAGKWIVVWDSNSQIGKMEVMMDDYGREISKSLILPGNNQ